MRHLLIAVAIGIEERVVVGQQIDLGRIWRNGRRWTNGGRIVANVLRGVEFAIAVCGHTKRYTIRQCMKLFGF